MKRYLVVTSCTLLTAFAAMACEPDPAGIVTQDAQPDTPKDTGVDSKADSAGPDTATLDTGPPDTSLPDTALADIAKPDTSLPDTSLPDLEDTGSDGGQCLVDNEECVGNVDCCSGICTASEFAYGGGQCISPLIDGSYCEADNWCKSNSCVDSQCVSSSCAAAGDVCYTNDTCCTGKCSVGAGSLDPGACIVPVADGQACTDNNYCISNFCDGGVCATASCQAADEVCDVAADCCSGLCSNNGYAGSYCVPAQPDGYACQGPEYCASNVCDNGICGAGQQCLVEGSTCGDGCCEGLYCPSSLSGIQKCSAKEVDGSYCLQHFWCTSGQCHNSQCQPATCAAMTDSCDSDAECCSGVCSGGVCWVPVGSEQSCSEDKQCKSENCSAGSCGPAAVTFADIYNDVLIPNGCASGYCHGAPKASGFVGIEFTTQASAFSSLVYNDANIQDCGMSRYVVPHNADVSILWHRARPASMDGGDPCFEKKMPLGSMGLDSIGAAMVESWINSGAKM